MTGWLGSKEKKVMVGQIDKVSLKANDLCHKNTLNFRLKIYESFFIKICIDLL